MSARTTAQGRFWALVPVFLLGGLVITVLGFVHVALTDPSFAVQDRYYARALTWDEHVAAERRSASLGWRLDVAAARTADGAVNLTLSLVDRGGAPVRDAHVDVEAFPVARSRRVQHATFTPDPGGSYSATLPADRGGRWELSIDATRGAERFTQTVRVDVPEGFSP